MAKARGRWRSFVVEAVPELGAIGPHPLLREEDERDNKADITMKIFAIKVIRI